MQAPFERTLRALAAERRRRPVAWLVALAIIGAWTIWAAVAPVGVHVTSVSGRVEAKEPVHVLRAEVDGRIVAVHAALGQEVAAGDILYEIDDREPEIRRTEAEARVAALAAERAVLEAAVAAANAARSSGEDVLQAALAEAKAKSSQARIELAQAEREVTRISRLGAEAIGLQELERLKTAAASRRAEVGAAQALAERLAAEEARDASDRTTALERMRQELARLEADKATAEADARAAEVARERRKVRVPVAGRLGDVPTLRAGDYVTSGQELGAVVPRGDLHAVAFFQAERALGWVRPGAPARLRLDAFPWTWFGQIEATVSEVALEPKGGLVRVELELARGSTVPLGHGLTGAVEVEVEETTPLALLLRAAGRGEARADTTEGTATP